MSTNTDTERHFSPELDSRLDTTPHTEEYDDGVTFDDIDDIDDTNMIKEEDVKPGCSNDIDRSDTNIAHVSATTGRYHKMRQKNLRMILKPKRKQV